MRDDRGHPFGIVCWVAIDAITKPNEPIQTGTLSLPPTNEVVLESHVTVSDGQRVVAGKSFTKVWRVKNAGNIPWTSGYTLRFWGGTVMTIRSVHRLPKADPHESVDIFSQAHCPCHNWATYGAMAVE